MKNRSIFASFLLILTGLVATAQTPTQEQLNQLKNLPQDQQNALVQSVLSGKGDGTGKRTDPRLDTPETIQQNRAAEDQKEKEERYKTIDGHRLRIQDEDPELRADDSILIDLMPIEREEKEGNKSGNGRNSPRTSGTNRNLSGSTIGPDGRPLYPEPSKEEDLSESYGRDPVDLAFEYKPLTDDQKSRINDFRQRILKGNPYKLNRSNQLCMRRRPLEAGKISSWNASSNS